MNYDLNTKEGMQNAINWQTAMVGMLGDGGMWAVPRSNAIYTVYNSDRKVVRQINDETVDLVFKKMGWTIEDGQSKNRQSR